MRSIGIIRELDKSGGVKLPEILMGICGIKAGDAFEMYLDEDRVVLKKHPASCIFCGSERDLRQYMKRSYCCSCAEELKNF